MTATVSSFSVSLSGARAVNATMAPPPTCGMLGVGFESAVEYQQVVYLVRQYKRNSCESLIRAIDRLAAPGAEIPELPRDSPIAGLAAMTTALELPRLVAP